MPWGKAFPDAEALRSLEDTGFGWLTADGRLIPTEMYQHLAGLRGKGVDETWLDHIDGLKDSFEQAREDFIESHEDGDHIPWHCFYGADGDLLDEQRLLTTRLQMEGWVRIGTWLNSFRKMGMEFQGARNVISDPRKRKAMADLAAMLDTEPRFSEPSLEGRHGTLTLEWDEAETIDPEGAREARDVIARMGRTLKPRDKVSALWATRVEAALTDGFDLDAVMPSLTLVTLQFIPMRFHRSQRHFGLKDPGERLGFVPRENLPARIVEEARKSYIPVPPRERAPGHSPAP
jgi:hypothetical protein